jgi:ABC-type Na+ efflux pump permease subunit
LNGMAIRLIASKELRDILSEKVYWLAFLLELIIVLGVILLGIAFAAMVNPVKMAVDSPDLGIRLGFYDENGAVPEERILSALMGEKVTLVRASNRSEMLEGILDGSLMGGIVIPEGYDEAVLQPLEIELLLDPSKPFSSIAQAKVERALDSANEDLARVRMGDLGLEGLAGLSMDRSYVGDPATPIESPDFVEAMYLMVIPLVLIFPILLSANMTSDSIVGEKENGTLGILVACPLSRFDIILGKMLPILLLANIQFLAWLFLLENNLLGSVRVFNKPFLLLLLNLGAVCFIGVSLLISTRARSSKESNLYLTIVIMAFVIPLFMGMPQLGLLTEMLEGVMLVRVLGLVAASPALPLPAAAGGLVSLGTLAVVLLLGCAVAISRLEPPPSR